MRFAISAITNSFDGMSVHHATVARILSRIGDLTLVSDSTEISSEKMNDFDFVFRYGWSETTSWGYNDANFDYNIASDPAKNVLIAPFCMRMLPSKAISQVNSRFNRILYDSSLSEEHGSGLFDPMSTTYIHPTLGNDLRSPTVQAEISSASYRFLHISNGLYWIKGADIVVDAFVREFSAQDNVELYLVLKDHDGMFSELKRRMRNQGREHQIKIIGNQLNQSELASLYESSDCYVCASRYDTFSLPTLEAAVFGLQIIAHDRSGMRDYLPYLSRNQYIQTETQQVTVPEGAWRENQSIEFWEPKLKSAEMAMRQSFERGHGIKAINQQLLAMFNNENIGILTMEKLLS